VFYTEKVLKMHLTDEVRVRYRKRVIRVGANGRENGKLGLLFP
jgi:hypothetical protein